MVLNKHLRVKNKMKNDAVKKNKTRISSGIQYYLYAATLYCEAEKKANRGSESEYAVHQQKIR